MAFEGLSEKLQGAFKDLRGQGVVSEKDFEDAMRVVKMALLEADVNFKVVKEFVATVKEKALGAGVLKSLTPDQMVIKIVKDELVDMMGGTASKLTFNPGGFTVIMLVGLQGTGKTTTAGKLAAWLKQTGKHPMLAACDVYRPAAIDQLEIVGKAVNTPVYVNRDTNDPEQIASEAVREALRIGCNVLIIDTAGRLQIDQELMDELKILKASVRPHEILLVVDALTGQDAVNIADGFNQALGVDGIIMTKMDGKPIKFMGTGEKYNALEPFHPDRIASRILGMGDVMSLIEQAENAFDEEETKKLEEKIRRNKFDLEDFLGQMRQINKLGGLSKLIDMIPGISAAQKKDIDIILSMTPLERAKPNVLNASRRKRIAKGSGHTVQDVNQLIKKYEEMKKMTKVMANPDSKKARSMMRNLGF